MEGKELTSYDLWLFGNFLKEGLEKHVGVMKDFWENVEQYKDLEPGEHFFADASTVQTCGYRIAARSPKMGKSLGVAAYPFVWVRSLKITDYSKDAKLILRKALETPIIIDGIYFVFDTARRIAGLSEEAYLSSRIGEKLEASVILGREEAYAILSGELPTKTRKKLIRMFGFEEGEWEHDGKPGF